MKDVSPPRGTCVSKVAINSCMADNNSSRLCSLYFTENSLPGGQLTKLKRSNV